MKTLLLGLVLASAPAFATPLNNCLFCFAGMDFSTYVHPVTVENTPEWAQVPNARAWYEIELGILTGQWEGMMLVLRGLLFMEDRPHLHAWLDIVQISTPGNEGPPPGDTPEPAAWLLMAAGGIALSLRRWRIRAGGGGAVRRSSSST